MIVWKLHYQLLPFHFDFMSASREDMSDVSGIPISLAFTNSIAVIAEGGLRNTFDLNYFYETTLGMIPSNIIKRINL